MAEIKIKKQCKQCFHFQVCANVLKNQLFIREYMLKERNPKCEHFISAADVAEVVHGKWLRTKYEGVFECSECYNEWYVTGIARIHPSDNNAFYCPCCGAKMDGDKNG